MEKIKLLERKEIAKNTFSFTFEKPKNFQFKAGQFADFTLIDPSETDSEGDTRAFSLCNPPYEKHLMIATRMRDTAFKRVLKNLPIGSPLHINGPSGSFTLHNNKAKPAVFLTGGIGITPVRSIIMQAVKDKLSHSIYLFYGNNTFQDAPFLSEFEQLEKGQHAYKFIPTLAKLDEGKSWKGETGFIKKEMIKKYLETLDSCIFYICGPAAMVVSMRSILNGMGVDDDDIRTEEFSGY